MWPRHDGEGATMARRFKQTLRAAGGLLALASFATSTAVAGEFTASFGDMIEPEARPIYLMVGEPTRAPIGWVDFCIEYRPECATKPSEPRDVGLTSKAWVDMVKVNAWVNQSIKPMTDLEHWDVVERSDYAADGDGDSEDYVLVKSRALLQAGWPTAALLITVVCDRKGEGPAVLTVTTARGEFILDNQEPEVLPWTKTGYRFVKRQSQ